MVVPAGSKSWADISVGLRKIIYPAAAFVWDLTKFPSSNLLRIGLSHPPWKQQDRMGTVNAGQMKAYYLAVSSTLLWGVNKQKHKPKTFKNERAGHLHTIGTINLKAEYQAGGATEAPIPAPHGPHLSACTKMRFGLQRLYSYNQEVLGVVYKFTHARFTNACSSHCR
jgi:hypothetical protein